MKRRLFQRIRGGAVVVILLVGTMALNARVFRAGPAADELLGGGMPWEAAARTPMTVNGRPAMVHVYTARFSEPAAEQVRARFEALGATVSMIRSEEGATGTARWPDRMASFIVIAPYDQPLQQIVVYYPTPGAAVRPVHFPVATYPGGEVATTISDEATDTFTGMIRTTDPAGKVHGFYARALGAEGWTMVAGPAAQNGTVQGMAVYERKKSVCVVQVSERLGRRTLITLLVKGGTL